MLTQAEVEQLPVGSRVRVVWSGGNGPHEYVIARDKFDRTYAEHSWGTRHRLDMVGERPLTTVELVEAASSVGMSDHTTQMNPAMFNRPSKKPPEMEGSVDFYGPFARDDSRPQSLCMAFLALAEKDVAKRFATQTGVELEITPIDRLQEGAMFIVLTIWPRDEVDLGNQRVLIARLDAFDGGRAANGRTWTGWREASTKTPEPGSGIMRR